MKILLIAEELDLPESHFITGLQEKGHTPWVLLKQGNNDTRLIKEKGIQIDPIPLNSRCCLASIRIIKRTLKNEQPDIVHCLRNNKPLANTLLAIRGTNIPLIAYRGTSGHLHRLDPGSRLTYLSRRIHRIVCVSNAVRNYMKTVGVPESRTTTIYKGHKPEWYTQDLPIQVPQHEKPTLAFAGTIRPVKAVDVLLDALTFLPHETPVQLNLIGPIRDKKIASRQGEQTPPHQITYTGAVDHVPKALHGSDLFIMPTRDREGLPRAVIEAMSLGICPIVTQVGGMPELVEHQQSGYVVPPDDPQALAKAIHRLITHPAERKRLGKAAQEQIQGPFNISHTIEKTEHLYREVLS